MSVVVSVAEASECNALSLRGALTIYTNGQGEGRAAERDSGVDETGGSEKRTVYVQGARGG